VPFCFASLNIFLFASLEAWLSLRSSWNREAVSLRSLFAPLEHSTISWRSAGGAILIAYY
jgi:hypothetical protein